MVRFEWLDCGVHAQGLMVGELSSRGRMDQVQAGEDIEAAAALGAHEEGIPGVYVDGIFAQILFRYQELLRSISDV